MSSCSKIPEQHSLAPNAIEPAPACRFDIAIIGAGLSGLMLVQALLTNKNTAAMRILLLDKSPEDYAPRTWCFWEKDETPFDDLVEKSWKKAEFFLQTQQISIDLHPYSYKMINAENFRKKIWANIATHGNVTVKKLSVGSLHPMSDQVVIRTDTGIVQASLVFDSRFDTASLDNYNGHLLYQQFAGWYVHSDRPVFDQRTARLMDFRMPQNSAVAFSYVLPMDSRTALVEYTLFTPKLHAPDSLETSLTAYLENHYAGTHFQRLSREYGVIPMSDFPVQQQNARIIPIGTAGGCTKPSSGYTFSFVRQHTEDIIASINKGEIPGPFGRLVPHRFSFYDRVLLSILTKHPQKGAEIFFRLFKKNSPSAILNFMGNRSSLKEELSIFSRLPISLFLRSAIALSFRTSGLKR